MIKKKIILLLTTLAFFSCNEEINYRTPFEEKPILYCVLNADNNTQYVMLKKSYFERMDEKKNFISDAKVQFIRNNETIELRDTIILIEGNEISMYYTKDFSPNLGEKVKVKAILNSGKVIASQIVVPEFTKFYIDQLNLIIPPTIRPEFMYTSWTLRNANDNLSYLPRLTIHYKVRKNDIETEHIYEIPDEYVIKGNTRIPIYPLTTQNQYYTYWQKTMNTAFMEISRGDENKSDYTIQYVNLKVYIMEKNLAAYSASIESFNRGYTVKVYETTISNIDGGLGVFGAYVKRGKRILLDEDFVTSFGYKVEPDAVIK
jgi:hypothetical protein